MRYKNKIITFALIVVSVIIGLSFFVAYLCAYPLLRVLDIWLNFVVIGVAFMGLEKLSESEFGAALVFFGGVAGYIIYCFCK